MFNNINNLWTAQAPRHAESSDAHQYIQRHDPDQQRRRRKKRQAEESAPDEIEGATLSVKALKTFLEKLLSAKSDGPLTNQGEQQEEPAPEALDYNIQADLDFGPDLKAHKPTPPLSAKAAEAAAIYQKTHIATKPQENKILMETTDTARGGPEIDLSATDLRSIHKIIEDLKILSENNIEHLNLPRASSFLESLQNAIETAKQTY